MTAGPDRSVRWTSHALQALVDRRVSRQDAEKTVVDPEFVVAGAGGRLVFMRRFDDKRRHRRMLIRVISEET